MLGVILGLLSFIAAFLFIWVIHFIGDRRRLMVWSRSGNLQGVYGPETYYVNPLTQRAFYVCIGDKGVMVEGEQRARMNHLVFDVVGGEGAPNGNVEVYGFEGSKILVGWRKDGK